MKIRRTLAWILAILLPLGALPAALAESASAPPFKVAMEVTSQSENPMGYTPGEVIRYRITVTNSSALPASAVPLYEFLNGAAEGALIQTFTGMGPGETRSRIYEYTVQDSDAAAGCVTNQAAVILPGGGTPCRSETVSVSVFERGKIPEPTPEPRSWCALSLTGVGEGIAEWTLEFCGEHAAIAREARALIEASGGTEDAWQQVIALWAEALNGEFDVLYDRLPEADRPLAAGAKAQFYAQLACRRAAREHEWPEDPARVARIVAEALMNQCAALCCANHTAPGNRPDSLTTGPWKPLPAAEPTFLPPRETEALEGGIRMREILSGLLRVCDEEAKRAVLTAGTPEALVEAWQSARVEWLHVLDAAMLSRLMEVDNEGRTLRIDKADDEGRALVEADRAAFGNWLDAREKLLAALYPESEAVAAEVIAQAVRARVIEMACE